MSSRPVYTTIAPHRRAWLLGMATTLQRALSLDDQADGLDVMALVCGWSSLPDAPWRADLLVEFDDTAKLCRALAAELRGLPSPDGEASP